MKAFFALEKFLVRWIGFSMIGFIVCRQAGVKRVPVFLLTTTGRKSGRAIVTPIFYFRTGSGFCVIGSKGGAPEHPLWFLNLQAKPDATVRVNGQIVPVRARVAQGEERDRLWKVAATAYPPYDEYQARAGKRQIPVVVLDRQP
jgi:deazaflavin-dependent oxidoreductase (nitroreductase family)